MTTEPGRLPDWVILGAAKSGTTSLAAWLADHPQVFVSKNKELHYFTRDAVFERGEDWYRQQFAEAAPEQVAGEATPSYLFSEVAAERMAKLIPDAQLIVLLRDPIDRAYSQYWYNRTRGVEEREFDAAIAAEDADPDIVATKPNLAYLTGGRYLEQLQRYEARFGRDQLHVLLFEDLKDRPQEVFSEACRLLGVAADVIPDSVGAVFNPSHTIRSQRVRQTMMRWRAWDRLPRRVVRRLDTWNRAPMEYPPLDPKLRARLDERFAPENDALAAWWGRDLSAWRKTSTR